MVVPALGGDGYGPGRGGMEAKAFTTMVRIRAEGDEAHRHHLGHRHDDRGSFGSLAMASEPR